MARHWAVVNTKYRQEMRTFRRVERQGFRCYLPMYRPQPNRLGVRKTSPLFDRMFFVLIEKRMPLDPIFSTKGVHGLIMVGDCIGKVRDVEVKYIRSLEDKLGCVIIAAEEPPGYDLRQPVLWTSTDKETGEVASLPGLYLGGTSQQRATVLFAMMGKEIPIEVQKRDLVAA